MKLFVGDSERTHGRRKTCTVITLNPASFAILNDSQVALTVWPLTMHIKTQSVFPG